MFMQMDVPATLLGEHPVWKPTGVPNVFPLIW
jgi:hypothetical protein